MRIGLFGIQYFDKYLVNYQEIVCKLEDSGTEIWVYDKLFLLLPNELKFKFTPKIFSSYHDINGKIDQLFSIGGDGTILESVTIVRDSGIPIMGINLGNLGFLSSISRTEILQSIDEMLKGNFSVEKRTLLRVESENSYFGDLNFALNEFSVHRKDNLSMINIHVYVNDQFLNSYWADGLIISTPTGSTGYSLSCQGPIVEPNSSSFLITPISTHNLNVRPVILPDESVIKLKVTGRNPDFFGGMDSRFEVISSGHELVLTKCKFQINLIRISNKSFFDTIREKLNWGLDKRN